MWVEGGDIQDELLDQLSGLLAPPEDLALTPTAAELEGLALAVAARWPDQAGSPGESGGANNGESVVRRTRWAGPGPRRIGAGVWRAGSVAAGLVLLSASAAAAAAGGGVPLPRPVRVVAYTVGLPVDSPALDDTHQHIKELGEAVQANDRPKAEATVRRLHTDLKKVPAGEKKVATPKVEAAIKDAANTGIIQNPSPATATTAPTTSTTVPAPASATTVTSVEAKEREEDKGRSSTTTTTRPTATTTRPDPTTTTTASANGGAPATPTGDPGQGGGATGPAGGGDPATTPTTAGQGTTTTTTSPPPAETTTTTTSTTTTTQPTTTTSTPPPEPQSESVQP